MTPDELDEWFQKCHENLQPLDKSYFKAAPAGSQFLFGTAAPLSASDEKSTIANSGNSSRDITDEEINKRRDEIIAYYKSKGLHDKALELKMIGEQWEIIHADY
jgi:hypothetical protein